MQSSVDLLDSCRNPGRAEVLRKDRGSDRAEIRQVSPRPASPDTAASASGDMRPTAALPADRALSVDDRQNPGARAPTTPTSQDKVEPPTMSTTLRVAVLDDFQRV